MGRRLLIKEEPSPRPSRLREGSALILAATLLLAACGKQGQLEPVAPRPAPQKPATATRAPTPQEMLKPGPQAAPARVDDQNRNLGERGNDPFNLPPPK